MPRRTYKHRLQELIDNPAITVGDKSFTESLLAHYNKNRSLTRGRARWVVELENKYQLLSPSASEEYTIRNQQLTDRIADVGHRVRTCDPDSWSSGYIKSIEQQLKQGRRLSDNQIATLNRVDEEHSADWIATCKSFSEDYKANKDGMRDDAIVVANYYSGAGQFFHNLSSQILTDQNFEPKPAQYNKLVRNKYAQRVLNAHNAEPKYQIGMFVELRATYMDRAHYRSTMIKGGFGSKRLHMVIKANAGPVVSSCKGAKRYLVLPVGDPTPFTIEERHIKKAPAASLKK
tara:strand:+ start:732 stop:1598 length:867 start_codon:yes stop_codon:yes gene_type:complete